MIVSQDEKEPLANTSKFVDILLGFLIGSLREFRELREPREPESQGSVPMSASAGPLG